MHSIIKRIKRKKIFFLCLTSCLSVNPDVASAANFNCSILFFERPSLLYCDSVFLLPNLTLACR